MTTLIAEIPEKKAHDVSDFIKKSGGKVLANSATKNIETDDDEEVTHGQFFGENIKRVLKTFFTK